MGSDRNTAERNAAKRRGIRGAAKALRKQAAKAGNNISQEQAERRVRKAVTHNEKRNNRG